MDQGENKQVQLDLFYDYRNNVALYPKVQEYFRKNQPPTLVVWGRNDHIFPWQGAEAYRKDLKTLDVTYMDGGHFILESTGRRSPARCWSSSTRRCGADMPARPERRPRSI